MKLALLLPGYIESPDYRHLVVLDNILTNSGYTVIRVDACNLWSTGNVANYTTTNYVDQAKEIIEAYLPQNPTEIVLIGHSLGSLVALCVGNSFKEVTKIVCLSPPIALGNSDHKWVDGIRTSKKDLPGNSDDFRVFSVPYSFVDDRKKYSFIGSVLSNKKSMTIIIGEDDPSYIEAENIIKANKNITFVGIKNMGHDFRQSEELCEEVANEVEKFIKE